MFLKSYILAQVNWTSSTWGTFVIKKISDLILWTFWNGLLDLRRARCVALMHAGLIRHTYIEWWWRWWCVGSLLAIRPARRQGTEWRNVMRPWPPPHILTSQSVYQYKESVFAIHRTALNIPSCSHIPSSPPYENYVRARVLQFSNCPVIYPSLFSSFKSLSRATYNQFDVHKCSSSEAYLICVEDCLIFIR